MIGRKIGNYRILSKVGQGGISAVYKARDLRDAKIVALKLLPSEVGEEARVRFEREFALLTRLSHPNIVEVYEAGETEGELGERYFTMAFIEGEPLLVHLGIPAETPPPLETLNDPDRIGRLVALFDQICEALAYLHRNHVVHRDIKPDNILVTPEGVVKLMDFGVHRRTDLSVGLTKTGTIFGSAPYVSPEEAAGGEIDYRSDLYSLGVVLYEALCGRRPFEEVRLLSVLLKHVHEEPTPILRYNPEVNPHLARITERLLRKNPRDRFQTARELQEALRAVGSGGEEAHTVALSIPEVLLQLDGTEGHLLRPEFVGREVEKKRLETAAFDLINGHGGLIVLTGEGGIGKTRLLKEWTRFCKSQEILVLSVRCHPPAFPFSPFSHLLSRIAERLRDEESKRFLEALTPLLPDALPSEGAFSEPERHAILRAYTGLLKHLVRQAPLLLVIEDLHQADEESVALLNHLVQSLIVGNELDERRVLRPLLVVVSMRSDETPRARRQLAALFRQGEVLSLGRLSEGETARMVRSMMRNAPLPETFSSAIFRESEGNPFFIVEVLKTLLSEGLIFRREGRWVLRGDLHDFPLPPSIEQHLRRRIDALYEDARRLLAQASVIGPRFSFDFLLAVTGEDEETLLDHLEYLKGAGILVEEEGDRFRFAHDQLRRLLYRSLLARRRRALHRRIAEILAARSDPDFATLVEIAWHYRKAADGAQVLRYSHRAARLAAAENRPYPAIEMYREALRLIAAHPDCEEEAALLEGCAAMYRRVGKLHEALRCLLRRRRILLEIPARRREEAAIFIDITELYAMCGMFEKAIKCARRALLLARRFEEPLLLAQALTRAAALSARLGEDEKALRSCDQAASLLLHQGDDLAWIRLRIVQARIYNDLEFWKEAWAAGTEAHEFARRLGSDALLFESELELAATRFGRKETMIAANMATTLVHRTEEIGSKELLVAAQILLARIKLAQGNERGAIETAEAAIKSIIGERYPLFDLYRAYFTAGEAYRRLEDLDTAYDNFNAAVILLQNVWRSLPEKYRSSFLRAKPVRLVFTTMQAFMRDLGLDKEARRYGDWLGDPAGDPPPTPL